ncbi:MAG: aminopeptidase P family N-terminal domain-containing protein [Acidimicrobiia bacterium]
MAKAKLARVELPDFGMPTRMPELPAHLYQARIDRLRELAWSRDYDAVVVYSDREHSANLSYLSGFDPRFEEALLVVGRDLEPAILVGNECWGMAEAAPLRMRRHRFQEFSLPSQPRDKSRPLIAILADEGIGPGTRVGVVGWKSFADPALTDIPSYLADAIRGLTGDEIENATDLLIDPAAGLRVINELEQLLLFEYASCATSSGVRRLLFGLEPRLTEQQAVRLLEWNGMPLSCHLMLTAGPRASLGLLSPSDRSIERGDPLTVAFGIWGALNCRAGFMVEGADELPVEIADYVDRLVGPYFEAVVEWYQALRVGQTGGALQEIIDRRLGDPFFGIFLNPGHQLHLDEWVNSPVWPGSPVALQSGMAMQVDIIPATGTDYFTTNIEDGIVLADQELRRRWASEHPESWSRIEARREFMRDVLGIDVHDDVLPLSNIPAYLPPFLLSPEQVMVMGS